jgi:hypothetical protein
LILRANLVAARCGGGRQTPAMDVHHLNDDLPA